VLAIPYPYTVDMIKALEFELGDIRHSILNLESLKPSMQITSGVLNFIFGMFQSLNPKVRCLDTFFAESLELWMENRGPYGNLNTFSYNTTRIMSAMHHIQWSAKGLVLIPIHVPGHWILAILDLDNLVLELYDSYRPYGNRQLKKWKEMLQTWIEQFNIPISKEKLQNCLCNRTCNSSS